MILLSAKKIYPDIEGIYIIINVSKNKSYIGESKNIHRRFKDHQAELKANRHINAEMQNDYNNGDTFYYLIVDILPNNISGVVRMSAETFYMLKYDTVNTGYNKSYPIPPTDNRYIKLLEQNNLYRFLQEPNI